MLKKFISVKMEVEKQDFTVIEESEDVELLNTLTECKGEMFYVILKGQ